MHDQDEKKALQKQAPGYPQAASWSALRRSAVQRSVLLRAFAGQGLVRIVWRTGLYLSCGDLQKKKTEGSPFVSQAPWNRRSA